MINILYALNGVFHKGGTEAVILNYFNNIDKKKFHIDFLVHGFKSENLDNETHNYLKSQGSTIYYVTPRGQSFLKNKKEIKYILEKNHYDIVHSHMDAAGGFFLKEARSAGVKIRVAHSHNTNHQINKGNAIKNLVYKFILNNAINDVRKYGNLFIACSKEAGNWLFGDKDFVVLNNAVDVDKYLYNEQVRLAQRSKYNIKNKIVIGHVGRFSEQKNHKFIVEIFKEIYKKSSNTILMLIGSGELESRIKQEISELCLENNTMFMGSRSDVNELMQAMDVFILPSLFEGLPVVGIEAQVAGLPCVVSDTVSKDLKITPYVCFLSLENTPSEWAECILNMCNIILRTSKREDIISTGYDIRYVIKKLEEMYTDIYTKIFLL